MHHLNTLRAGTPLAHGKVRVRFSPKHQLMTEMWCQMEHNTRKLKAEAEGRIMAVMEEEEQLRQQVQEKKRQHLLLENNKQTHHLLDLQVGASPPPPPPPPEITTLHLHIVI